MANQDIALMAHLMRRAGFGATYEELQARAAKGYEATVEELLHPEEQPSIQMDLLERYFIDWKEMNNIETNQTYWTYRMVNTKRPLEEKMALFWHSILVVGNSKCEHGRQVRTQLERFRSQGLGSFKDTLLSLASDPAMIFYLDNQMSHKNAINENWGRELLELFSLGVGMDGKPNYSEDDVKVAARAFTGWTIGNSIPRYPYGRYLNNFFYNPNDHDDSEKTFLGETGRWNGEDVIDIICKQPSAARFVARHLYNFFVADEPQVPQWQRTPPKDMALIKQMEKAYFDSNYEIRSMLRVLFNSDSFKNARFARVKSPAEVVASTLKLVGGWESPKPGLQVIANEIRYMGQDLLNPPTVEGWHTGAEWIDSGTLVERINFCADQMGDTSKPGVQAIIKRLAAQGKSLTPNQLVDGCLESLGHYQLPQETRKHLVEHITKGGPVNTSSKDFGDRVAQVLQLIVSTQEYQFA
ncbi:MAG: DUF1800 domain-containing protein [SAR202 cluster bacterium]|nr:DUF1800 domain-containing protein [SAR202 cluster bacterium]